MKRGFDVVVIGSGEAGTNVATAARERGRSVAVVDERPFGGTCALRGCDPKKVLVAAARLVEQAERYVELGVLDRAPLLDWSALMRFKRTFTEPVPQRRERMYEDAGIVTLHGHAQFADHQSLIVDGERVHASQIVIATGAKERHVAAGDDMLLTSEAFLELGTLPASLLFVGGGYITFELAHVAARARSQVTIVHNDARPLAGFEPEVVEQLLMATRNAGIEVHLETPVTSVERMPAGVMVRAIRAGQQRSYRAENGVLAAGRIADLDALSLEAGGVERTKKGVKINEFLQSVSNPNVYAAGDAADGGGLPLTPVAVYEGEIVASNILDGNSRSADFRGLVTIVYSIPPLGAVGLTESQARERGWEVEVRAGDMKDWYSTRHVAARVACYKVVLEKGTGRILGATVLGPHAEEQINVLALAIRNSLSGRRIADTLFAYPTGSSDLAYFVQ